VKISHPKMGIGPTPETLCI